MQVTITYSDHQSLSKEEVVRNALHHYGRGAQVQIYPDSTNAHDFIYFGIQQILTHQQISLIYDSGASYQQDLKKLRAETLYKLEEILDSVIVDNEAKIAN
jgi:hypothetical protein